MSVIKHTTVFLVTWRRGLSLCEHKASSTSVFVSTTGSDSCTCRFIPSRLSSNITGSRYIVLSGFVGTSSLSDKCSSTSDFIEHMSAALDCFSGDPKLRLLLDEKLKSLMLWVGT